MAKRKKDFVDGDLLSPDTIQLRAEDEPRESGAGADAQADDDTMARQKEELFSQVAVATSEIDRLRRKQEQLEKEKMDLEDLTRRQEEYENGKRDMIDKLRRSIVLIEKEETQAVRMVELLDETRSRFEEALSELVDIDESSWLEHAFRAELDKAIAQVGATGTVYRKGLARIDAASWHKHSESESAKDTFLDAPVAVGRTRGFGFWFKMGVAVSLPVIFAMILMFVAWLWLTGVIGPTW